MHNCSAATCLCGTCNKNGGETKPYRSYYSQRNEVRCSHISLRRFHHLPNLDTLKPSIALIIWQITKVILMTNLGTNHVTSVDLKFGEQRFESVQCSKYLWYSCISASIKSDCIHAVWAMLKNYLSWHTCCFSLSTILCAKHFHVVLLKYIYFLLKLRCQYIVLYVLGWKLSPKPIFFVIFLTEFSHSNIWWDFIWW